MGRRGLTLHRPQDDLLGLVVGRNWASTNFYIAIVWYSAGAKWVRVFPIYTRGDGSLQASFTENSIVFTKDGLDEIQLIPFGFNW